MNTSSTDIGVLAGEIKPLILLYAERFGEKDPTTGKPPIDVGMIKQLKEHLLNAGIGEKLLVLLEPEVKKDGIKLMGSRKLLREIKGKPNLQGNVYHNQKLILGKIIELLTSHESLIKDSL